MPTTKEVALSRDTKTLKKSAVAFAAKKRSAPKKVGKIASNILKTKGRSSASSLRIKNNIGKNTAKPNTKTVTTQAKMSEKMDKIVALHARKTAPVVVESKSKPKVKKEKKQLPTFSLAVLSPYRFPLDVKKIAAGTARYGGVFFVLIGAFFTVLMANNSFSAPSQTAAVSLSNTATSTVDCMKGENYLHTSCADIVQHAPHVEFILQAADPLSGSVQVKIKVAHAQGISLTAYNQKHREDVVIGTPVKVSNDTWEMYWDTTKHNNGNYKLKAIVKNGYGTYESVSGTFVSVNNAVFTEVLPIAYEEEPVKEDDLEPAQIKVFSDEYASEFLFEVLVKDADAVKVYAKNKQSNKSDLLGNAELDAGSIWKYKWNLKGVPAGEYVITAYAVMNGTQRESNSVTITVDEPSVDTEALSETQPTNDSEAIHSTPIPPALSPGIAIEFPKTALLKGVIPVKVNVSNAQSVELYALPKNSLIQKYIGSAKLSRGDSWDYYWDTQIIPNGEYKLIAYVKNTFGTYSEQTDIVKVSNTVETSYTEAQQKQIEILTEIAQTEPAPVLPGVDQSSDPALDPADQSAPLAHSDDNASAGSFDSIISNYAAEIDKAFQRLAAALRLQDGESVRLAKDELGLIERSILNEHGNLFGMEKLRGQLASYFNKATADVEHNVQRIEKMLAERTTEKTAVDSDEDGVSDYDEVNIYDTDPFNADSDGDGFTDGDEILKGFNPLDADSEVLIAYESPKTSGLERSDVLVVESVISAQKNEESDAQPAALISGKGLPNSFVTLYIYSTPIVVTLKTDAAGVWNYRFDKELEDGDHQVYVGVTDNTGKIVAKSAPFFFIKEAEAFGPLTDDQVLAAAPESSILSSYMIYLVLAISVVAIGLVLILLGWHLDSRQRKYNFKEDSIDAAI